MNGDLYGLLPIGMESPFPTSYDISPTGSAELVIWICAIIALYSALRVILEPDVMRKLPFLNVFSFAISGIIALLIPHPLGIIAAVAYFVGSTFESNAIASTWAGGVKD